MVWNILYQMYNWKESVGRMCVITPSAPNMFPCGQLEETHHEKKNQVVKHSVIKINLV